MSVNIVTKQEEKILSSDLPTDTIDNKEAKKKKKKSIVINKEKEIAYLILNWINRINN